MPAPRACLSDMPWHIKQRIVGSVDPLTRIFVRKVSKNLRQFADRSPSRFTSVVVTFERCQVVLKLSYPQEKESFTIEYRQTKNSYNRQKRFNWRQIGGQFDPVEQIVKDLSIIFKHPNSSIDQLTLSSNNCITRQSLKAFTKDKKTFLDTFERTFSQERPVIKGINIGWPMDQNEMLQVLTSIKPSTLDWIKLEATPDNSMKEVVQTEQFQNADRLAVKNGRLGCLMKRKIGTVTKILNTTATLDDLKDLLNALLHKNDTKSFNFLLRNVDCNIEDFLFHLYDQYGLTSNAHNQYVIKKTDSEDYLVILHKDSHLCFTGVDEAFGLDLLAGDYVVMEGDNDN